MLLIAIGLCMIHTRSLARSHSQMTKELPIHSFDIQTDSMDFGGFDMFGRVALRMTTFPYRRLLPIINVLHAID